MNAEDQPQAFLAGLHYTFQNRELLELALTHPSFSRESEEPERHYQRLEFLGDAVINLVLAELLYQARPDEREGVLTQARAALARGPVLASTAQAIGLPEAIRLSEEERRDGGAVKASILEDALEAIVGAVYLDGGYDAAYQLIRSWFGEAIDSLEALLAEDNPKGQLQEWAQGSEPRISIDYRTVNESGPAHARLFEVEVLIDGESLGLGCESSRKGAETLAARQALQHLRASGRLSQ